MGPARVPPWYSGVAKRAGERPASSGTGRRAAGAPRACSRRKPSCARNSRSARGRSRGRCDPAGSPGVGVIGEGLVPTPVGGTGTGPHDPRTASRRRTRPCRRTVEPPRRTAAIGREVDALDGLLAVRWTGTPCSSKKVPTCHSPAGRAIAASAARSRASAAPPRSGTGLPKPRGAGAEGHAARAAAAWGADGRGLCASVKRMPRPRGRRPRRAPWPGRCSSRGGRQQTRAARSEGSRPAERALRRARRPATSRRTCREALPAVEVTGVEVTPLPVRVGILGARDETLPRSPSTCSRWQPAAGAAADRAAP